MASRTTLILDDKAREAAQQLARHYDCGVSEAIRRAVLSQRDATVGVTLEARKRRQRVLEQLFELFEGSDPEADVKRLKGEDPGF